MREAPRERTLDDAVEIVERFAPLLETTIARALQGADAGRIDIDDVIQETRVAIVRSLPGMTFANEGVLVAWLRRVAERKCLEIRRFHQACKRDARRRIGLDGAPTPLSVYTSPTAAARRSERREPVRHAIHRLPTDERAVVELHSIHGLGFRAVAERLELGSASTARSVFARALRRLEGLLARAPDAPRPVDPRVGESA